MTDKINTAIVGFGRWGQSLFESSLESEKLWVTHVVTRSPKKVAGYCEEHGLVLGSDVNDVLNNDSVDALIIATPHSQHFAQLMAAAEAKKHVYCEKPFTLTGNEATTAITALRNAGCKVAIGHNRRFAPNTLALKKMLEAGWFGELVHIDGTFSANMAQAKGKWRDSVEESPAGGMTSLGIHVVDMFVNLMGPVEKLTATSECVVSQCDFDDNTTASMVFESSARGHLTTLTSTPMCWQIRLHGTNGWAELRDLDTLVINPAEGARETFHYPGYDYPGMATLTAALDAFASAIRGEQAFPVRPDEIEHATQILEAIIVSAETGKWISIH